MLKSNMEITELMIYLYFSSRTGLDLIVSSFPILTPSLLRLTRSLEEPLSAICSGAWEIYVMLWSHLFIFRKHLENIKFKDTAVLFFGHNFRGLIAAREAAEVGIVPNSVSVKWWLGCLLTSLNISPDVSSY